MADRSLPPPSAAGTTRASRLLQPRIVLPLLAVVLVLVIVFTPQSTVGRVGNSRLTTYSTESQGARGLFETLRRLGWRTERRLAPFEGAASTDAVYFLLNPPIAPTAAEVHRLLEAVRGGASLVFVAERGTLADSLKILPTVRGGPIVLDSAAVGATCDTVSSGGLIDWPGGRPWLFGLRRIGPLAFVGDTTFLEVTGVRSRRDAERDSSAATIEGEDATDTTGVRDTAAASDTVGADSSIAIEEDEDDEETRRTRMLPPSRRRRYSASGWDAAECSRSRTRTSSATTSCASAAGTSA